MSEGPNPNETAVLPQKPYSLTFMPQEVTIEVDPADLPFGDHGLPGSILDIAMGHGIDLEHACGGVVACSTCHVLVRGGKDSCPEANEQEEDMLDQAPGLELCSRLACQTVPDGSTSVVVEIPDWNRNFAREAPHS
ncbi:MAG: ferredoxin [Planctomycetes bacterium]|jgi:2Fe-2S ferredoxin|nr:ferredoxin [Planctomycetota bacterium]